MLYPKDLIGVADNDLEAVFLNGRKAFRVKLHMVQFTEDGMRKIGQGILDVAERYGLSPARLKELMQDSLYLAPPNPGLYFLFHIPELDADIHVSLPRKFWRFSDLAHELELPETVAPVMETCSAAPLHA